MELNVIEQCLNLYKTGVVQRGLIQSRNDLLARRQLITDNNNSNINSSSNDSKIKSDSNDSSFPVTAADTLLTSLDTFDIEEEVFPRIHGLVFNPSDGMLKKLDVNYLDRLGSLEYIYGLYKT